jgi:hypothetical protein
MPSHDNVNKVDEKMAEICDIYIYIYMFLCDTLYKNVMTLVRGVI